MIKNFFKVALRNFIRNKAYSGINLVGLSLGLASSILLGLFIYSELSYDRHFPDSENIYRVQVDLKMQGKELNLITIGMPVANIYREEIPEFAKITRFVNANMFSDELGVKVGDNLFSEKRVFYADSNFRDVFDIKTKTNGLVHIMNQPNTALLCESKAKAYFGNQDPIGKSFMMNETEVYTVVGTYADFPKNTHFHPEIMIPMLNLPFHNSQNVFGHDCAYSYVRLRKPYDLDLIKEKLDRSVMNTYGPGLEEMFQSKPEDFEKNGNSYEQYLMPINDIHLNSHTEFELEAGGSKRNVYFLFIIAVLILSIAVINFINLSTAKSSTRAKEAAIRKVIGSERKQLLVQFLAETIFISLIALMFAMILIETFLPGINNTLGTSIELSYKENIWLIPALIGIAILTGVISGIYSAWYISSQKVIESIKNQLVTGRKSKFFRNTLVVVQFSIAILLFVGTFIVHKQLYYIQNKDLGCETNNILSVKSIMNVKDKNFSFFKKELEKLPMVSAVSFTNGLMGEYLEGFIMRVGSVKDEKSHFARLFSVDWDFQKLYDIEMKEGRFFDRNRAEDEGGVIFNESAVKLFNLGDDIIGKQVYSNRNGWSEAFTVVGIVKDFHVSSLHNTVEPIAMTAPGYLDPRHLSISFSGEPKLAVNEIKKFWTKVYPNVPFEFEFMSSRVAALYKNDRLLGRLFTAFSVLSIIIACLGLIGLTTFVMERKQKEVGIRKSLGARNAQVFQVLMKEFTRPVLLANLIAWPLSYYAMNSWLERFAFRTEFSLYILFVSGFMVMSIAFMAVLQQTYKATRANPTESLRYE